MKLNNKKADFSSVKSTKWDDAWYFELKNNDIQSSSTSMKKTKENAKQNFKRH